MKINGSITACPDSSQDHGINGRNLISSVSIPEADS